jgi:hypothetical protein
VLACWAEGEGAICFDACMMASGTVNTLASASQYHAILSPAYMKVLADLPLRQEML